MWYSDDLIVKRVSRQVRERTRENMEIYNMSLSDAFEEAARNYAKRGSDLYLAFYTSDFREYIPSAYQEKYLDFEKYPLAYTPSGKVQLDLQTVHSIDNPPFTQCPFCGSEDFFIKEHISGPVHMKFRFDGEVADNGDMYEGTTTTETGVFAYCSGCRKRIFRYRR